jgi:RNA recognition motif-containing protein
MATKLYVGNLSFGTTEGDLSNLFASCGTVTSCSMIIDKFTGKSRGFAFVEMSSSAEAAKAISELHGKEFDGRALTVNEAKPREDRPRGGGFGGGGGGGGGYGGGGRSGGGGGGYGGGGRRDRY